MRVRKLRKAGLLTVAVGIGAIGLVGATGVVGAVAVTSSAPAGYSVVTSAPVTAVNGRQTAAPVACPGPTKPVGGGAHVDSASTLVNLNSSYPVGKRKWLVRVNNVSGADVTFEVYAVCIDRPAERFTVQTTFFSGPAHHVSGGTVDCGSGVVYGGGVESYSKNPAVSIHEMAPAAGAPTPTWVVHMNNPTAKPEGFGVFTICRKGSPRSVAVSGGERTSNPAGTQTTTSSSNCSAGQVPLSGGVLSDSSALGVSMSSSLPQGQGWSASGNNTSTSDNFLSTSAICTN
jgi:hypothetical protein